MGSVRGGAQRSGGGGTAGHGGGARRLACLREMRRSRKRTFGQVATLKYCLQASNLCKPSVAVGNLFAKTSFACL
eukprot:scaffold2681_cov73-Phaeocystis_antarctica.AAC.3